MGCGVGLEEAIYVVYVLVCDDCGRRACCTFVCLGSSEIPDSLHFQRLADRTHGDGAMRVLVEAVILCGGCV